MYYKSAIQLLHSVCYLAIVLNNGKNVFYIKLKFFFLLSCVYFSLALILVTICHSSEIN